MNPPVGRNDRCPCGSGKKFKRCCGFFSSGSTDAKPIASVPVAPGVPFTHSIPIGVSGHQQYVSIRPTFGGTRDPRNHGKPEGVPGLYKVVFTLSRPGFPLRPEGEYTFENNLHGESHVYSKVTPETTAIEFSIASPSETMVFRGYLNNDGCLAKIVAESISAEDFHNAEEKAWNALSPILSTLSVHLDVPVNVYQVDMVEHLTGALMGRFTPRHRVVGLQVSSLLRGSSDFRFYASLYRESMNTNSPLYQFLCLFKIIEGIAARRKRIEREKRQRGESSDSMSPLEEVVPADPSGWKTWLDGIYPPTARLAWHQRDFDAIFVADARGADFGTVVKDFLRPIRNKIAHGLVDGGESGYSIDEAESLHSVNRWLPLTKCIVRYSLRNEFPAEFMRGWRSDGSFDSRVEEEDRGDFGKFFSRK
jgi:hypothetical protein